MGATAREKEKVSKENNLNLVGAEGIAGRFRERFHEALIGLFGRGPIGPPPQNDEADGEKNQCIDRNEQWRSELWEDKSSESGTHESCDIHLHPSKRDRRRELFLADDTWNDRTPNWSAEGNTNAKRKDAEEDRIDTQGFCPCAESQKGSKGDLPCHRRQDDGSAVHRIRNDPRGERKEKQRRRGSGRHQRERKAGAKIV